MGRACRIAGMAFSFGGVVLSIIAHNYIAAIWAANTLILSATLYMAEA